MELLYKLFISLFIIHSFLALQAKSSHFSEYIGDSFNGVKFSDVPINPNVNFQFILSFAIDYDTSSSPTSTNGKFNVFWDRENLGPSQVSSIKSRNSNVKVAISLGGDTVHGRSVYFNPTSVGTWVSNAVNSLTSIIHQYNVDGIDVNYEHFNSDTDTFAECIGQVITRLKQNGVISFASIAPFDDDQVQGNYMALWRRYGSSIDYVNFQFYAYSAGTTVSQFLSYFNTQTNNYKGANILVSFSTDNSGGLKPYNGFFTACNQLKSQNHLNGIFVWSADSSKNGGFTYEKQAQALLTT